MSWQLITSDEELRNQLEKHAAESSVAIDTEFMRQDTFFPKPALVQLCFDEVALLVDPTAVSDFQPLVSLFENEAVTKVIHSASEDLEVFKLWPGVMPRPLFDSQRAAALLNLGFGMGYRALVAELLDVELPKGETRSNWLARPLSSAQCEYAAQDVIYLRRVYDLLVQKLVDNDKLDWVMAEGDEAIRAANQPTDYSQRVKSAWKLPPRQLLALRQLINWREQRASQIDKPRNWVLDDKSCYTLASELPKSLPEMAALGVLGGRTLKRHGQTLLAIIEQARKADSPDLPDRLPGPLSAQQRARLKQLRKFVVQKAEQLDLAPEYLLQNRDLEALVRSTDGEAVDEPSSWSGWRRDTVIEPLREILQQGAL